MGPLLRGNGPALFASIATLATWASIPILWSVNEWGVLSLAEVYWVLLVTAGWLLAVAGLVRARTHDTTFAAMVFVWSSVVPTVLLCLVLLSYAFSSGTTPD